MRDERPGQTGRDNSQQLTRSGYNVYPQTHTTLVCVSENDVSFRIELASCQSNAQKMQDFLDEKVPSKQFKDQCHKSLFLSFVYIHVLHSIQGRFFSPLYFAPHPL